MLFACGREEREQARLGSAMREFGGQDFVEDAEDSDFCEGMVRVTGGVDARVKRSAGCAEELERTR